MCGIDVFIYPQLFIREHYWIAEDNNEPSLVPRGFSGAMDVNSVHKNILKGSCRTKMKKVSGVT